MLPRDMQQAVAQPQGGAASNRLVHTSSRGFPYRGHQGQRAIDGKYQLASSSWPLASSQPRPIPCTATRAVATAIPQALSSCTKERIEETIDIGFDRNIDEKYDWGKQLGKGGNGVVRVVVDKLTGEEYACKAIKKILPDASSDKKKAGHIDSIRREVEVLRRLEGSLNIIRLVDVFEDNENVFIVQELCNGGELYDRIGERHYSERTVASYMRAVLRTLAQCHSHRILHRDIKPGNFMLLDDSERSPLKAIDFGLAVPFDPENLPRTDLGLEGTPWYMAPEVLSSQVTPASDLWSAGVMAHQLLTGRLPFDDQRNPMSPSISAVWRSVLTDKVDYNMPWWKGISDEAKDFVYTLLNRDPTKRPTAKEALKHPWLKGNSSERSKGKQIDLSVVQRIQRFAQSNRFKRTVLQLIAEELLSRPGALRAASASLGSTDNFMGSLDAGDDDEQMDDSFGRRARKEKVCPLGEGGVPIIRCPNSSSMHAIFKRLNFTGDAIDKQQAVAALAGMGYKLEPSEVDRLVDQVDTSNSGRVRRAALAASQIDWRHLQQHNMQEWLDIARQAFAALDKDQDGFLRSEEILNSIRAKLPDDELRGVVRHAMEEAGDPDAEAMDFDGFLRMLKVGSVDSLDIYDDRWERRYGSLGASSSSLDRLQSLLDSSVHGSDGSSHGGSQHGKGRFGRFNGNGSGAAAAPAAPAAAAANLYAEKPWNKPMVNFNFDFGAPAEKAQKKSQPPETQGAPESLYEKAFAGAAEGKVNAEQAASYFNNGAVRGGGHFDKRMHGGSLYRNAVVGNAKRGLHKPLAPVKE